MTMQDQASSSMNDSGTNGKIDTPLTQPRSGFDLEDARRNLIAMRVKFGANSPKGHRCSNLVEQIQILAGASGEQKAHLHKAIRKSIAELNANQ